MKTTFAALFALVVAAPVTAQTPTKPHSDHAQHQQGQPESQGNKEGTGHEQHKGCCVMVNGKMECRMMKGDAQQKGKAQDHSAH